MINLPPYLVDTHAHFDPANENNDAIIQDALDLNIHTLAVGCDTKTNQAALDLAQRYPQVYAACGFDWSSIDKGATPEAAIDYLQNNHQALHAIGELGIDCHYPLKDDGLEKQIALFSIQAEYADHIQKPFILHTRDADDITLSTLDNLTPHHQPLERRGVAHSFTGNRTLARALLDRGFYISFSGIVTFRNATDLREVIPYIPRDRILIETDTPYLAPVPMRGRTNQPAYVRHTANAIAAQLAICESELAAITTLNAITLFAL